MFTSILRPYIFLKSALTLSIDSIETKLLKLWKKKCSKCCFQFVYFYIFKMLPSAYEIITIIVQKPYNFSFPSFYAMRVECYENDISIWLTSHFPYRPFRLYIWIQIHIFHIFVKVDERKKQRMQTYKEYGSMNLEVRGKWLNCLRLCEISSIIKMNFTGCKTKSL